MSHSLVWLGDWPWLINNVTTSRYIDDVVWFYTRPVTSKSQAPRYSRICNSKTMKSVLVLLSCSSLHCCWVRSTDCKSNPILRLREPLGEERVNSFCPSCVARKKTARKKKWETRNCWRPHTINTAYSVQRIGSDKRSDQTKKICKDNKLQGWYSWKTFWDTKHDKNC